MERGGTRVPRVNGPGRRRGGLGALTDGDKNLHPHDVPDHPPLRE